MILPNELRSKVRNLCDLKTCCKSISATGYDPWSMARICDISVNGLGLTCSRRFEVGTYLAVELQTVDQEFPRVVSSRVVHVQTVPNKLGWFIGCEFVSKLTEDELNRLLS